MMMKSKTLKKVTSTDEFWETLTAKSVVTEEELRTCLLAVRTAFEKAYPKIKDDERYDDPLYFWSTPYATKLTNHMEDILPLVKAMLCVPATSAPSECLFSTGGHIVSKHRSVLDAEIVRICCLIRKNMQHFGTTKFVYLVAEGLRKKLTKK